ncbi:hypothetical protein [Hoeflea prorocentri]|uniref:DUF2147 domain-containing protein n=1 Tax=Hoeflea prorocentri TaxID=1922333 RepID=A0A9X3ZGM7_9HYPH|nr:hypothetical protein [Hoeflea prorocentri]MCY6379951.1 hypothetical protein [Hoeflea prorocentri]MDA5397751.1 hypothetical protein [Hoeflea prorocentri]
MRLPLLIALAALCAAPVAARDRTAIYGTWGTEKQCARTPIKPGGTVLSEPFVISSQWLRHGKFWCRLDWGPVEPRENGVFTGAHAQCGEDSTRGYFLGVILTGDDLTLRWDFPLSNGPLKRC